MNLATVEAPNTKIAPSTNIIMLFLISAFWSAEANIYLIPANTIAAIAKIWNISKTVPQIVFAASLTEPIFLSELPCNSQESLRQEMKKLADEGKIIRLYNGVYYKPYKTIMGTEGRMSINKYIEKKYVYNNKKVSGFISGLGLYNKYGFTSQVPSIIEVTSNIATTKQRKINVDGYDIIVYKPIIEITDNNINELEFMSLMTDIDQFSEISGDELKMKLEEYINKKNIDFNIVKKYLPLFPDRIYKNIYNGGLMKELV